VRIRLLGAVEVLPDGAGGTPVPLGGLRLRGLCARLALDAGRVVPASVLVDDLWDDRPDGAPNALQALVSRLRRTVGADLVSTAAGGYRLELPRDAVDALRFGDLVTAAAAAADPRSAHALLGQALDLWRGPTLADLQDLPFAGPAAHRLAQRRADAVEQRARLALPLGVAAAEIDALTAQLDVDPLRESTAVLLGHALHAAGRQADALAVLDSTRDRLAEELGVDPGPELAAARLDVLRGTSATPPPPPARPAAARLAPLTSFVGRHDDVRRIRDLLTTARLVTLTGPGGAGKTRLAVEAVAVGSTESRVVELAGLGSAEQLPAAVLSAVGGPELIVRAQEEVPPDTTARLVSALSGRPLVLVLDNCEHLVEGAAVLTETVLRACPQLRVLATSREPLGVPGEVLHPVDPLPEADAVRLFLDRAAAVRPGFAPTADDAAAVAVICRRLDGQPLPIELAAARLRTLSPAEIAARLDDRFRLLTTGPRTAQPRHQTLRAVVDWSWDLLSEPERTVAARLAVFAGGATAAAAERVCSAPDGPAADEVFELLAALVDKSLVVAMPQPDSAPTRYRMLETIREYAGERLDASGTRVSAERAHAAVVLELVEAAEPHLRSAEQLRWLARLRTEADEIEVALRRTVAAGDAETAHRIVAAVGWSWVIRGLVDDASRWLDAVRALDGSTPPVARAVNLAHHAVMVVGRGDYKDAQEDVEAALAIIDGLPRPLPPSLELLGPVFTAFTTNDYEPVRRLMTTSADPWVRGLAAQMLATIAENEGEMDEQRRHLRVAHEEFRRCGDRFGLGMAVNSLGELEDIAGEADAAARAYEEAIALATELGNEDDLPQFLIRRASLLARRGDVDVAREQLLQLVDMPLGSFGTAGTLHIVLATVERVAGDLDAARAALEVAATRLEDRGPAVHQRRAYLAMSQAAIEVAAGDLAAARRLMGVAAAAAVAGRDGPVAASVAEVGAGLLLAEGDPAGAALLLGVATKQRGALDRGNPDVIAVRSGVRAALRPVEADEIVRRGRELPREDGMAELTARLGPDGAAPPRNGRHAASRAAGGSPP
jgi:predicted ATPase/DNA-binding SARP family transcriptional activator